MKIGIPLFCFFAFSMIAGSGNAQDECSTISECAQDAAEAAENARLSLQIATPRGAVMAFNLDSCPVGWDEFAAAKGRVIVGAGTSDGLSTRNLGDRGGSETHKLTAAEMPGHTHNHYTMSSTTDRHRCGGDCRDNFSDRHVEKTTATGGGAPHNNMPPFHTLLYCERQ